MVNHVFSGSLREEKKSITSWFLKTHRLSAEIRFKPTFSNVYHEWKDATLQRFALKMSF